MSLEKARPQAPSPLQLLAFSALSLIYVPIVVVVVSSFLVPVGVGGDLRFSFANYVKVLLDREIQEALFLSLEIALVSAVVSTCLGLGAALGLARMLKSHGRWIENLLNIALALPELVFALGLLMWFIFLQITLGKVSVFIAHVTFSLSYVVIIVRAQLRGIDPQLYDVAQDLGATEFQVLKSITLPLLWPAIMAGFLVAFTLSFDDFLITFYTSGGDGDTLPVKLYSMLRTGLRPELNALATLLMTVTAATLIGSQRLLFKKR